jgi:hypothetical protein
MEEYIYTIRTYLPVEFETLESNEFIDYLVSAYLENLPIEKFQFSFTAFHMLYMSYIFKVQWFLKQQGNTAIETSLNNHAQQYKCTFNTLFDLSQINEKTSLEKLLLGLSFHVNDIGICKNFVDVRNNCSHASGRVYYKKAHQVEHYILEAIDNIVAVQNKVKPQIKILFEKFIEETYHKNWIEQDIKVWIIGNYLSQKDIEEILNLKPPFLRQNSDNTEIVLKKILYSVLVSELVNYLDDKGDYVTKSISSLMKGLVSQIDVRKTAGDSMRMKNTQELIEEKIVPILTELSNEELIKAQEILKLNSLE